MKSPKSEYRFSLRGRIETTQRAMAALDLMLAHTIEVGDPLDNIADGISALFTRECDALDEIFDMVCQLEERVQQSKQPPKTRTIVPSGIGLVEVIESDGRRFITTPEEAGVDPAIARRLSPQPVAASAEADKQRSRNAMALRRQMIAEALGKDVDIREVAQALNLKTATVERVIGQLTTSISSTPSTESDAATVPTAVNQ